MAIIRCPRGFELSKGPAPTDLRCDGPCGKFIAKNTWLWSCAKSDYDLCVDCAAKTVDGTEQGPPRTGANVGAEELDEVKRELWEPGDKRKGTPPNKRRTKAAKSQQRRTPPGAAEELEADSPSPPSRQRRSPAKPLDLGPEPTEVYIDPALLANLRPPQYEEEQPVPLVEPVSGAPLALEPLPELPPIKDPTVLSDLQGKRRWLQQLFELEITRELRDQSSTPLPGPVADAEGARRARVRQCVAKFQAARADLLAEEKLQLACL